MPKKKKLKLENLKVTSFITDEESRNIKGMTYLNTNCADTDCASVQPIHLCEQPIEPTQGCTPGSGATCDTCVSCVTCYSACTCGAPCTYSATAVDQLCFECTQ